MNVYIQHIGAVESTICDRYLIHAENALHMLRDYNSSRDVWESIVPHHKWGVFFGIHVSLIGCVKM